MRAVFGNAGAVTREIGGQFRPGTDKIVKTIVGPICKICWPEKTDVEVALVVGCDPRNARRYMSGELPVPAKLLHAINAEILKRFE